MPSVRPCFFLLLTSFLLPLAVESVQRAFRRDPGHPQWHHGAFHDLQSTVREDVRRMLHTRAEVCSSSPFPDFVPAARIFDVKFVSCTVFVFIYNLKLCRVPEVLYPFKMHLEENVPLFIEINIFGA